RSDDNLATSEGNSNIIATLNSVYNRQYNITYEIVADSSDGMIQLVRPRDVDPDIEYGHTEIITAKPITQDEQVIIVREIIKSGNLTNQITHYGSNNGSLFIIHVNPRGRGETPNATEHFFNAWPKADLSASFDNIGMIDAKLGDSFISICPDPLVETNIPILHRFHFVNRTEASSCRVSAPLKATPTSCLIGHSSPTPIDIPLVTTPLEATSANLDSTQSFNHNETHYIISLIPANATNDLLIAIRDLTNPVNLPYGPENSACKKLGFRTQINIR
ncbi:MAG: hypothetical protein HAW61_05625, partial [Candidatus Portiera sp.]|nr:hypothetical protein [Portiera sp.]